MFQPHRPVGFEKPARVGVDASASEDAQAGIDLHSVLLHSPSDSLAKIVGALEVRPVVHLAGAREVCEAAAEESTLERLKGPMAISSWCMHRF